MNLFAGVTQQPNQNLASLELCFVSRGMGVRSMTQGQGSLDPNFKNKGSINGPDHCSRLPMIDQSKHQSSPTAITEAAPLCKSHSRSCVQQKPLRRIVAFSKIMHISSTMCFATTLARKRTFRCKCTPYRRGSPSTRSDLQGGERTRDQSGRRSRRNCGCNASLSAA